MGYVSLHITHRVNSLLADFPACHSFMHVSLDSCLTLERQNTKQAVQSRESLMGVKRLLVLTYERLRENDPWAGVVNAGNTNRVDRDTQRSRAGAAQKQHVRKAQLDLISSSSIPLRFIHTFLQTQYLLLCPREAPSNLKPGDICRRT